MMILTFFFFFTLASSLKICKLNDPNRDECIRSSMEQFLLIVKKNPESVYFPSIEPFIYENTKFAFNNGNLVKGWFLINSLKNYGLSDGKVTKIKSDFSKNEFKIQGISNFPKLFGTGTYKSDIALGVFKIESKGQFNTTLYDLNAKFLIKGKLQNRDGQTYVNIYHVDILPSAKNLKLSASGLFPDEQLSKYTFILKYKKIL